MRLFDAHFHAGFLQDPAVFSREAVQRNIGLFAATVSPHEHDALQAILPAQTDCVFVGAGLHPRLLQPNTTPENSALLVSLSEKLSLTRFVGEIGLDFSERFQHTKDNQLQVFRAIAEQCGSTGGRVLSLHAVQSAADVLDILEETSCLDTCSCIFHWFSGTSDDLQRAIGRGCYFSASERMLASKRGRAYAAAIPVDRLLLETDAPSLPPDVDLSCVAPVSYSCDEWETSLVRAQEMLVALKGEEAAAVMSKTAATLFDVRN